MAERESLPEGLTPGFVLWLTGLPASGKTTLAREVQRRLLERGIASVMLDSDELRKILTPEPKYTAEERDTFYGVIVEQAVMASKHGINVLIAATANRRAYRDAARKQIPRFAEIHVRCALEICRQRDPKGLYARAASNEIQNMPGLGGDYEPPLNPEVVVDTDQRSIAEAATKILDAVEKL